ncbi:MAG TPA: ribonuclease P protein component [Bacteroidales bacterium]|nr:ribonuclease P protein component [Bacteroidales bacterium]
MRQTFTKDERLHKKILIEKLFREGESLSLYPLRLHWLFWPEPGKAPAQLLVSVPKHALRKAVQRNLIKRRIREAYRRNKALLPASPEHRRGQLLIGITYSQKEILPYRLIEDKIIVFLQRLTEEYAKSAG